MNKNSIIKKITIFFGLFLILIFAIAFGALQAHKKHQHRDFFDRLRHSETVLGLQPKQKERVALSELEATLLSKEECERVKYEMDEEKYPKPPHLPPMPPHMKPQGPPPEEFFFKEIKLYTDFFDTVAVLKVGGNEIGILDEKSSATFYFYFLSILGIVLLGITLLYSAILKSLSPIKELGVEIEAFGAGITPKVKQEYRNDEVGRIQQAFHAVSTKISGLIDAREIFLKNAAHELKTPIAKGVIVAHMVSDERQKKRLLDIFSSMTQIIEGIMTAEKVIAQGFAPHIEPILLRGFCEKIRKKLLLTPADISLDIGVASIAMADPGLLEIALSNLFENSVKFKNNSAAAICKFENGKISIQNNGNPLEEPINRYFEPFFKETSIRNENGMGLGLYLSKKVLEIQGIRLSYRHESGINIFEIG